MHLPASFLSRLVLAACTLTATAACVSETGAITVDPGSGITVTPASPSMAVGDSVSLTVTLPPTLQGDALTYVSANTAIAIARPTGWIVGVARGRTSITIASVSDPRVSTIVSVQVTP
jgi:uncharacterized protein YjdB